MEFVVNGNNIVAFASVCSAIGVILGIVVWFVKKVQKWNDYGKSIDNLQKEQYLQIKTMYAILDGLHQLGCNGKTTEASQELQNYLTRTANHIETDV